MTLSESAPVNFKQQHLSVLSFRDPPTQLLTSALTCGPQLSCVAQQFGLQSTFSLERTELGSLASYRNLYLRVGNRIGDYESAHWTLGVGLMGSVCSGQTGYVRWSTCDLS